MVVRLLSEEYITSSIIRWRSKLKLAFIEHILYDFRRKNKNKLAKLDGSEIVTLKYSFSIKRRRQF